MPHAETMTRAIDLFACMILAASGYVLGSEFMLWRIRNQQRRLRQETEDLFRRLRRGGRGDF